MGGLSREIPQTYRTMLVATLAIAGILPLAGFFSKDMILGATLRRPATRSSSPSALVTAGLTAFYMFRLVRMTFFGEFRGPHDAETTSTRSPATMTVPLWSSPAGSVRRRLPRGPGGARRLEPLRRASSARRSRGPSTRSRTAPRSASWPSRSAVAVAGIRLAWRWYGKRRPAPADRRLAAGAGLLREDRRSSAASSRTSGSSTRGSRPASSRPSGRSGTFLWRGFDALVIDGIVNASAFLVELSGDLLRFFTTGNVRNYALGFTLGRPRLHRLRLGSESS